MIEAAGDAQSGGRARDPFAALSGVPSSLRADAARIWMEERRAAQARAAAEQAWTQTPFYRFMASGDRRDLLTNSQQVINDNLLRPT
jgi:hypothetical protein